MPTCSRPISGWETTDVSALLDVRNFSVAYGAVPVVRDVSLALQSGEIMALLGRNGMGKTTLLRGLLGLAPVRKGTARFADADISAVADRKNFARRDRVCSSRTRDFRQSYRPRKSADERARSGGNFLLDAGARA